MTHRAFSYYLFIYDETSHPKKIAAPSKFSIFNHPFILSFTLIQIGKTKQKFFQEAEQEYLKRLQPYAKIQVVTLKESVLPNGSEQAGQELVKKKEASEILAHLPKNSFIVALDERGKAMNSMNFAQFFTKQKNFGQPNITFIIGGPYGLDQEIIKKADLVLSFSAFTFTHEMIRILLLEQVYRACMILAGKRYHY